MFAGFVVPHRVLLLVQYLSLFFRSAVNSGRQWVWLLDKMESKVTGGRVRTPQAARFVSPSAHKRHNIMSRFLPYLLLLLFPRAAFVLPTSVVDAVKGRKVIALGDS